VRILDQPAFVLHARAWRETSLIVELLTRDHGRLGVVARGVQGPKRQVQRAALQPLQLVSCDYLPRGELARLLRAEALDAAPRLRQEAALAMFYVHELLLRLLPRQDAAEAVFERYASLRLEIGGNGNLAWQLRRFERDLLDALGIGPPWDQTEDGQGLDPAARYRIDPSIGPVRDRSHAPEAVTGAALLALARDVCPPPEQLSELRLALRTVIAHQLGGTGLKAWSLMPAMRRVRAPQASG
jgi:DNA repair protein RecO (recombination protein O)